MSAHPKKTGPAYLSNPGSKGRARLHTRIIRATAYSVASVLAILMTTAVLPPLVADQSDRAVVNAPVTLLTAPIAGEIATLSAKIGQRVEPGETLASIRNTRVDRTTLVTLESKDSEVRESILAARRKRDADLQYVAALDAEIRQQTAQMLKQLEAQIVELRARVAAAEAAGQEKMAVLERQTSMVARDVASPAMLKPATEQYSGARSQKEAETAKLNQKLTQLDGVRKGVFVGDDSAGLAALAQKRRDIAFDAQRLAIEEAQLTASEKDQQRLLAAERERIERLTQAQLEAPEGGEILNVGANSGRHVSAGDSLATLVNCEKAFVVAIFSYRQAQNLAVGTRVRLSGAGGLASGDGTVREILPKTSDKVDEQFAVPFPQTERREMYVLVAPDWAVKPNEIVSEASLSGAASCPVGQWLTVTRESGWIPSTSVVWSSVQTWLTGTMASLPDNLSALQRQAAEWTSKLQQQTGEWVSKLQQQVAEWRQPGSAS